MAPSQGAESVAMPDPDRATTAFDVNVHGFGFPNRFPGSHVLAALAAQRRLDELIGIGVPDRLRSGLGLLSNATFWDGFGLCGGMSWTAIDNFESGAASDRRSRPPDHGDRVFEALVARQADSMRGTSLVVRLAEWMLLPVENRWWSLWTGSVGRHILKEEWPAIRSRLAAGEPCGLCLLRSRRPADLGSDHQVVATGYEAFPDGTVRIAIYDPNHPGMTPAITFSTSSWRNRVDARQSTGEPIVGFFMWTPD
jgi:hypothetical protein